MREEEAEKLIHVREEGKQFHAWGNQQKRFEQRKHKSI